MDRVLATSEVNYLRRTETNPDDEPSEPSFRHVLSYDLSGDQVRIDLVAAGWGPSGDPEGLPPSARTASSPSWKRMTWTSPMWR